MEEKELNKLNNYKSVGPKKRVIFTSEDIKRDARKELLNDPRIQNVEKALMGIDKRCLKYGVIPNKKICTDLIKGVPRCHGCFAIEALAGFEELKAEIQARDEK